MGHSQRWVGSQFDPNFDPCMSRLILMALPGTFGTSPNLKISISYQVKQACLIGKERLGLRKHWFDPSLATVLSACFKAKFMHFSKNMQHHSLAPSVFNNLSFLKSKMPGSQHSFKLCSAMILPNLSHFESKTKRCWGFKNQPIRPFQDSQHQKKLI